MNGRVWGVVRAVMPGRSRLVGGEGRGWGEWEEENGREREGRGGEGEIES